MSYVIFIEVHRRLTYGTEYCVCKAVNTLKSATKIRQHLSTFNNQVIDRRQVIGENIW